MLDGTCHKAHLTQINVKKVKLGLRKPSLTLNLGINGLKVTSEPPPMATNGRTNLKDRIAQRSPIQTAAMLDVT
ncbi:hypothetical protein J6590_086511 [Homalodisca vitripennis]|nr:hypothetical protein J6590_086511 [Homalodisca vitripennis]